jgi:hypothetical protein
MPDKSPSTIVEGVTGTWFAIPDVRLPQRLSDWNVLIISGRVHQFLSPELFSEQRPISLWGNPT